MPELAKQLHTLASQIERSTLRGKPGTPLPGVGSAAARIMLVMKHPDRTEMQQKVPFSGDTAWFIDAHLKRAGIETRDIYWTYLCKVFPGMTKEKKYMRPSLPMVRKSQEFLDQELALLQPELIIPIGADTMRAFGVKGSVNQNSGKIFDVNGQSVMPLVDPNFYYNKTESKNARNLVTSLEAIKVFLNGGTDAPTHTTTADFTGRDNEDYGADVEVEDFDTPKPYLYSVGLATADKRVAFKVARGTGGNPVLPEQGTPVFHNAKYDVKWIERYTGLRVDDWHDTILQAHLLGKGPLNLKDLAATHLGGSPDKFKNMVGTGKNRKQYDDVPGFLDYNSFDAWAAKALHDKWFPQIQKNGWEEVYNFEKQVTRTLIGMENRGLPIDQDNLKLWRRQLLGRMAQAEENLANLGLSPDDVDPIAEKFWKGKPNVKLTEKARKLSTSTNDMREAAAPGDEWVEEFIAWKQNSKFISTYLDNWAGTDTLHPSFNQTGTLTWRFSCSNPNLQNVTKKNDSALPFLIAAPPGYTFVSCDATQGEYRVMANLAYEMAGDRSLIDQLEKMDMHSATAELEAVQRTAVMLDQPVRTVAKNFNFGVLYGITAFGLSKMFGIPKAAAQAIIDDFYRKYPGIKDVQDEWIYQAQSRGYLTTFTGRPLHVPLAVCDEGPFYYRAEKQIKDFGVQGGLMEIIKAAMVRTEQYLVNQVHDEVLYLVPDNELEDYVPWIQETLLDTRHELPYTYDLHLGKTWGECKELENPLARR